MFVEKITSLQNPRVKQLVKLRDRRPRVVRVDGSAGRRRRGVECRAIRAADVRAGVADDRRQRPVGRIPRGALGKPLRAELSQFAATRAI